MTKFELGRTAGRWRPRSRTYVALAILLVTACSTNAKDLTLPDPKLTPGAILHDLQDQVGPTVLPYFCLEARNPQDFSARSKQPNSAHGVLKAALWADAVLCARRRLGWRPVDRGSG